MPRDSRPFLSSGWKMTTSAIMAIEPTLEASHRIADICRIEAMAMNTTMIIKPFSSEYALVL